MEPHTKLSLRAGEQAAVPLSGAGSAGYQWTWRIEGDAEAVAVHLESEPAVLPSPGSEPHGGSLGHLLNVTGLRAGSATIHLTLSRSFQPDRPPRSRHIVEVDVQSA